MEILNVIVAALATFGLGAIWYMTFSKPWVEASGVSCDENGRPDNGAGPMPYIMSFITAILVAGMLRHVMASSDITGIMNGILTGGGIGAFFITPWIMMNNGFAGNPFKLTMIDGGYAIAGCALCGAVLNAF